MIVKCPKCHLTFKYYDGLEATIGMSEVSKQTKFTFFEKETLIKTLKGAAIAGTGAAALYILKFVGTINFGPITPIIAAGTPIIFNAIKEWMRGE